MSFKNFVTTWSCFVFVFLTLKCAVIWPHTTLWFEDYPQWHVCLSLFWTLRTDESHRCHPTPHPRTHLWSEAHSSTQGSQKRYSVDMRPRRMRRCLGNSHFQHKCSMGLLPVGHGEWGEACRGKFRHVSYLGHVAGCSKAALTRNRNCEKVGDSLPL